MDAMTIDEGMSGLARPIRIVQVGRPDITSGRPGESLVGLVRTYLDSGGRQAIRSQQSASAEAFRQSLRDTPQSLPAASADGFGRKNWALDSGEDGPEIKAA